MRKVDVYLNLKKYNVPAAFIDGARDMARWYRENGDEAHGESIEMTILLVDENSQADGVTFGKLRSYTNRFIELTTAAA